MSTPKKQPKGSPKPASPKQPAAQKPAVKSQALGRSLPPVPNVASWVPPVPRRPGRGEQFLYEKGLGSIDSYVRGKTSHGSKGRKTWNFLTGAAKIAADLAPAAAMVAPFFLATHPPTQLNAVQAGQAPQVQAMQAVQANSVGLAGSNPFQTSIGINRMTTFNRQGVLYGARVQGVDKLADVGYLNPVTSAAWLEGDLMMALDLNPTGPAMFGTALIQQARIYNRYTVKNMAVTFVSSQPATVTGNYILSCTPDPDSEYTADGFAGTQTATAVTGAECFQAWQTGCTAWYGDKKQNFYARADQTDRRFVSPGIINLICNAPTNATSALGSLYISYDIEFTERSLEDSSTLLNFNAADDASAPSQAGQTGAVILGTPTGTAGLSQTRTIFATSTTIDPTFSVPNGSLPLIYALDAASFGTLSNFPVGLYLLAANVYGTGITATTYFGSVINYGLPYLTIPSGYVCINAAATAAMGFWILRCTQQTQVTESAVRLSVTATTVTTGIVWCAKLLDQVPVNAISVSQQFDLLSKQLNLLQSRVDGDTKPFPTMGELVSSVPSLAACVQTKDVVPIAPVEVPFKLGQTVTSDEVTTRDMLWLNKIEQQASHIPYTFVVFSFPKRPPGGDWSSPSHWRVVSIPSTIADKRDNDEARRRNFEFASLIWSEIKSRGKTKPATTSC